jgi:chromosome segregation ATPase
MTQNSLAAKDLSGEFPVDAGAQALHVRLQTAFEPESGSQDDNPAISAIDAARTLAAAGLRQSLAFENFQDRVSQLESGPDVGAIRENVRDLCEALLHITVETKKTSTQVDDRFESLSDAMAVLSGHLASQRQEVQANIAATSQLSEQLKQLQDEIAGQRAEAAQIKALILSTTQTLRSDVEELKDRAAPLDARLEAQNLQIGAIEGHIAALPRIEAGLASLTVRVDDMEPLKASVVQLAAEDARLVERFALLADDFDAAKSQVNGLEDTVAALADSSIRSSENVSVLSNALEAAKTQIFSLGETSEYLTERLRIAEQVVESFTRREKILASLHARAARTLQLGS